MANIVKPTDFVGEINLPGEVTSGNNELISGYIERYERELLIKLLGYDLYTTYLTEKTNPEWVDFITGKEYQVAFQSGVYRVRWEGVRKMLAYYVYYWYMRDNATSTGVVGETIANVENATVVSIAPKLVNAWNRMCDLYGEPGQDQIIGSAYNFLDEHKGDYPKWLFSPVQIRKTNIWSL